MHNDLIPFTATFFTAGFFCSRYFAYEHLSCNKLIFLSTILISLNLHIPAVLILLFLTCPMHNFLVTTNFSYDTFCNSYKIIVTF